MFRSHLAIITQSSIPVAKKMMKLSAINLLPAANFLRRLNRILKRSLQTEVTCVCTIYRAEMLMTVEI